ncbi:zinc finger, CCHC-type containing protein [Tanacetum coccineum]|uniref:Zinc finger, CCHC-type containing protein n=1 Tax=Tanacetum coccineum TaxID=301880 RepID=A0ABQ5FEF1_9ASTR
MAGNTVKDMTTNFGKLDKFEGHDFRRWQKKMHFLLTTLKVVYVLTTPMPELLEDATVEAIRIRAKWENDDYICRGHILNGMSDSLFDVYTNVESAKELWDSLESKYMAEDSSSKKFLSLAHRGILRAHDSDKARGKEGLVFQQEPKLDCSNCGKTGTHSKGIARSGKKEQHRGNSVDGKCHKGPIPRPRIIHETTAPYTPQQNGVAKRKNRALKEMGAEERLTYPKADKTLGEKGIDCIFVGYAEHSKAYRPKDIIPNVQESQMDDHTDDVPNEIPEPRRVIHQMDVKTAFLNGDLRMNKLYLKQPKLEIGTQVSSSRGARSKGTTYVNMKFSRFKKLGLSFLYVHQWIGTHGL